MYDDIILLQSNMEECIGNLRRIEQIDELAKNTLAKHQVRMPEKYANIQATLKLLGNLIANFRKRADNYEQELCKRAKINDLMDQIQFHRSRISDCEKMSEALNLKVQKKRTTILEAETKVKQMRADLLKMKTNNVKKVLLLENLEDQRKKEASKENYETRKATWRMKTEFSRACHTNSSTFDDELAIEKSQTVKALYAVLSQKQTTEKFIEESWHLMKDKLFKKEKKTNNNGLNGSLVFKMIENDRPCPRNSLNNPKLMIYDVLKQKYRNHKRQEQRQKVTITEEQFQKYTPLQVFGLIELKGGLPRLLDAISKYESHKSNPVHIENVY